MGKAVSKQKLAYWIVDVIAMAYQAQGNVLPLWSQSTFSWALANCASLTDVYRVTGWVTPNTSARFYNLQVEPVTSSLLSGTSR